MGYEMGDVRAKCAECGRKVPVKRTVEREGRVICWLCAGVDPWPDENFEMTGTELRSAIAATNHLHEAHCETCGKMRMLVGGQCENCVGMWPSHSYEIATPEGVVFERGTYTNQLHGGICIECERPAPVLTEGGYCEACVLQAMIEQEKR